MDAIAQKIEAVLPPPVREVCARLSDAGFEALAVGGAVRDAILGRDPGDWDVATSAHPDEVIALFDHTIPTGLQHGTVTVVLGKGKSRYAIEVTTFRGEGEYTDARRPDTVTFGVPLREDLARRDFVINAVAYDPIKRAIADPFGGVADLAARRLRAVGDARERFAEDGLRVMRAIRFAATLEFELEPETEAAIPAALPSLGRVSRERVRVELLKLLDAPQPSRGLEIAQRTGVFSVAVDPHLNFEGDDGDGVATAWAHRLRIIDAATDALVRLAALLSFARDESVAEIDTRMRELTLSNSDRDVVLRLYRVARWVGELPLSDVELRRRLGELGRPHLPRALELLRAQATAFGQGRAEATQLRTLIAQIDRIVAAGDALTPKELRISGGDVIRLLGIAPGKQVGELMAALFERVLHDPALNEPAKLEALAHELGDRLPLETTRID